MMGHDGGVACSMVEGGVTRATPTSEDEGCGGIM